MTNRYLSSKIVLNITRIPIPVKKCGKVYNTAMSNTFTYILRDMCISTALKILCNGGMTIFALDFVVNGYIMYEKI